MFATTTKFIYVRSIYYRYQVRVFQECNYNYHDESTEVKTLSLSL